MNDANARAVAIGALAAIARRGSGHALELRSNRNEVRSLKRRPRSAGSTCHAVVSRLAPTTPEDGTVRICSSLCSAWG